jgi:hypothetical protein
VADDAENVTPIRKASASKYAEIGSSGLYVSGGRVIDELHRRLRGDRAAKIFREMSDNDPIIGALIFAIDMMLREVTWHAEPAENATDETQAQFWADFVEECVNDMSMTWPQAISSITTFLPFGWAFHETVYKIRGGRSEDPVRNSAFSDGKIGWRKWALRTQETLYKWVFDDAGGIQGMEQLDPVRGGTVTIPIEKALLFRTTVARGNPEGRSILRNAYRPWYFKKRIEEIEAVGIERDLVGIPIAKIPSEFLQDDATDKMKAVLAAIKKTVTNLRRDSQEGIVFPREIDEDTKAEMFTLELLTTGGRRQFDTTTIIERYDTRILMTVLADFVMVGHQRVGARAVADPKMAAFSTSLSAYLDEIAGVINNYAIPRLMQLNGVEDDSLWPEFVHDDIKQVDLDSMAAYMTAYATMGGILDPALDAALRAVPGWPEPDPTAAVVGNATSYANETVQPTAPKPKAATVPTAADASRSTVKPSKNPKPPPAP